MLLTGSDQFMISGVSNSILTISRTNIIPMNGSNSAIYICSADTGGQVRSRNTTVFIVGGQPYLERGGSHKLI